MPELEAYTVDRDLDTGAYVLSKHDLVAGESIAIGEFETLDAASQAMFTAIGQDYCAGGPDVQLF